MENKKGNVVLFIVMIVLFVVIILIAGFFAISQYVTDYNNKLKIKNQPTQSGGGQQSVVDPTANWNIVTDVGLGIEFKYPTDFNSKYASFSQTPAVIVNPQNSKKIDSNGCYILDGVDQSKDSQITINNMLFCLSSGSDPGAGQLYNTHDYTTLKNGNYITLEYIVHTLNGCSPYAGTPDFGPCTDFMNNYNTLVVLPIQQSVGTLQFTK